MTAVQASSNLDRVWAGQTGAHLAGSQMAVRD